MTDQIDGSDVPQSRPDPPQAYEKFKKNMRRTLRAFESLDEASLAMLQHDDEYRGGLQRLLSPFPDLPAITASSQTPRLPMPQAPPPPVVRPKKAKKAIREFFTQNQDTVGAVWLHLLTGRWAEGFNIENLAGQLNAQLRLLHPTHDSNDATTAQGEFGMEGEAIVYAWMTIDQAAIAIAFRTQMHTQREVLQAVKSISELIVDRSAIVLSRTQGDMSLCGIRLRSPDSDPFAIDGLMKTHRGTVFNRTKEYFLEKWGPELKVGKTLRPGSSIDLTPTNEPHLCFFFACRGPFNMRKRFSIAPQDVFQVTVETTDSSLTSQMQTYDILIDGFFSMDSYKFL